VRPAAAVDAGGSVAVAAPPAAVAAPARAAVEARALALDQREQAIRRRELEIAEQRRVLAEEYRLLRATRESRAAASPEPARTTTPSSPILPFDGRLRMHAAGAGSARFDAVRAESFWSRVKRIMLGVSAS
jgi:hypothetical protein